MTTQYDKAKRWRPRFSVRTLVIVVTLVCCYMACWRPTKRRGVADVQDNTSSHSNLYKTFAIAPLVVRQDEAMVFTPEIARGWGRIDVPSHVWAKAVAPSTSPLSAGELQVI
jgi:hypothetical protein